MVFDSFGPHGAEDERDSENCLPMDYDSTNVEMPGDLSEPAQRELRRQTTDCIPADMDTASRSDPLGSWTGVPADDADEIPTQDADDL